MKHLRTVVSLLLITLLMAGMFTGCKNDPVSTSTTAQTDTTEAQISRDPVGSFVINVGAILELYYNADGMIVDAIGKNSDGLTIMDAEPELFGISCTDAVLELLPHLNTVESLKNNNFAVLLQSMPGSKEPSEAFLTDIAAKLQDAAASQDLTLHIFAINVEDLNTSGEMPATQAKDFLLKVLSIDENIDYSLNASNHTVQGSYAFRITINNVTEDYLVNAMTGDIIEGTVDSSFFDSAENDLESELPEVTQNNEAEPTGESNEIEIEIDLT